MMERTLRVKHSKRKEKPDQSTEIDPKIGYLKSGTSQNTLFDISYRIEAQIFDPIASTLLRCRSRALLAA